MSVMMIVDWLMYSHIHPLPKRINLTPFCAEEKIYK